MEREDVLENKNQSCFRWSQGSFATTLASMRPTSWTSWGRNMLAMEFGNYFNFTRGRFVVRRVSLTKAPNWGHTAHIGCILALRRTSVLNSNNRYGVDIMNEDIADNYAACVWWVPQINIPVIFSNSHKQFMYLAGNRQLSKPTPLLPPQKQLAFCSVWTRQSRTPGQPVLKSFKANISDWLYPK